MRAHPPGPLLCAIVGLSLLGGCRDAVLTHRPEAEANAALGALAAAGLDARKAAAGRDGFDVTVDTGDLDRAVAILHAAGLPRGAHPGLAELFGKPGLVASGLEEQVRYQRALTGEIASTLLKLDGVRDARVNLALPVARPDPEFEPTAPAPPVKASVLVSARPGRGEALRAERDAIRRLVAGAVAGLDPGSVTVVVVEAAAPPARRPTAGRRPVHGGLVVFGGVSLAAGLALCALVLLRRRSVPVPAEGG